MIFRPEVLQLNSQPTPYLKNKINKNNSDKKNSKKKRQFLEKKIKTNGKKTCRES
jgi:hypothetical protein